MSMTKSKKAIICSFLMAAVMIVSSMFTVKTYAAGEETLPLGEYDIGSFTFTDTNLTKPKTMPAGANNFSLLIRFKKADIDQGIGQVKLTVQIRDMSGNVIDQQVVKDTSGYVGTIYKPYSTVFFDHLPVSPGQKFQIFFDASSVNPSQSNGNFRSIRISTFVSYINVDNIIT